MDMIGGGENDKMTSTEQGEVRGAWSTGWR